MDVAGIDEMHIFGVNFELGFSLKIILLENTDVVEIADIER